MSAEPANTKFHEHSFSISRFAEHAQIIYTVTTSVLQRAEELHLEQIQLHPLNTKQ
jgi:hypothetical protein